MSRLELTAALVWGDTVWIDDLTVRAPDTATITTPFPIPGALRLFGSGVIGLPGLRRKVRNQPSIWLKILKKCVHSC